MIRGSIRSLAAFLVIGAALVATTCNRAEAAAIGESPGTVVVRGAVSEAEPPGSIGDGAPVVLRGSPSQHPKPAPERSDCDRGYYTDPGRGCLAPDDIYTADYGYWPAYGLAWPYLGLPQRHPRHGFSHRRLPGQAVHFARHPASGSGRGFAHR
jgi:hypothetical protein